MLGVFRFLTALGSHFISNHEIKGKAIKNKMQNDKILHLDEKLSPSSEMRLTETPSVSERPDLVPTSDNVSSVDKVNTLSTEGRPNVRTGNSSYCPPKHRRRPVPFPALRSTRLLTVKLTLCQQINKRRAQKVPIARRAQLFHGSFI